MPGGAVEVVDLIDLIETLTSRRDEAITRIYEAHQDCQNGFKPYQNIVDTGFFFLSGGLSEIIPPAARHIDASNLLNGTPFGGPNALIPQVREQALSRLGIGGDLANFIRNPLQPSPLGPIRQPWAPVVGLPIVGLPLPPITAPIINPLPLPPINSPKPLELGKVGGHRICVPWC